MTFQTEKPRKTFQHIQPYVLISLSLVVSSTLRVKVSRAFAVCLLCCFDHVGNLKIELTKAKFRRRRKERNPLFSLISIRFGSCEERRLGTGHKVQNHKRNSNKPRLQNSRIFCERGRPSICERKAVWSECENGARLARFTIEDRAIQRFAPSENIRKRLFCSL